MRYESNRGTHYFDAEWEIEDAWTDGRLNDWEYEEALEKLEKTEDREWKRMVLKGWRKRTIKEFLRDYPTNFDVRESLGRASPCMGACARFFGYAFTEKGKYRWLQKFEDVVTAMSSQKFQQGDPIGRTGIRMPPMGYDMGDGVVKSDSSITGKIRKADVKKRLDKKGITTVGGSRSEARKMAKEQRDSWSLGFLVGVKGHILALNNQGETVVDTAPRASDRRKITDYEHLTLFDRVKRRAIQQDESAKRKRSKKRKQREAKKNPPKKKRCPKGTVRNKKTGRCNKKR